MVSFLFFQKKIKRQQYSNRSAENRRRRSNCEIELLSQKVNMDNEQTRLAGKKIMESTRMHTPMNESGEGETETLETLERKP
jgi:hypothetical protein